MHVVTDEERREVAAALRQLAEDVSTVSAFDIAKELELEATTWWGYDADDVTRLADLIDPGDTSQSCRDAVACDRGAPETCEHWLDGECYALRTARPVDRGALLVEAEEAEKSAWYFALDHDEDELRDRLTEAAEDFSDMARRIREACGEVS